MHALLRFVTDNNECQECEDVLKELENIGKQPKAKKQTLNLSATPF